MPRKPMADKGVQTSLRLPRDLYENLAQAAGEKGIGEEIRRRLENSFFGNQFVVKDERVGDLLNAIAHAAAAVSKTPHSGTSGSYNGFAQAVRELIETFRPEDAPATPEDFWQGATLAAVALHAMDKMELHGRLMEVIQRLPQAPPSEDKP
jgi:hypothetical protein